jgi:hypothetical protein
MQAWGNAPGVLLGAKHVQAIDGELIPTEDLDRDDWKPASRD